MEALILAFAMTSNVYSLPPGLLSAICLVESGHSVEAIARNDGGSDSLGACQVKLGTAKMLGFKGTEKQLMAPNTNVKYAGKYLAYQLNRYNKDLPCAIAAYNTGTCLKHNLQIVNKPYVNKVMVAWKGANAPN